MEIEDENREEAIEVIYEGVITSGTTDYNELTNKPKINDITLVDNLSLNDLGIQTKLTAGTGISIQGNTISAAGGVASWGNITGNIDSQTDLKNKLDSKQNVLTSDNAGDNVTITTVGGVIKINSTGEPVAYLKNATVSGNTLTLKNKDDTVVSFTPAVEGGITDVKVNGSSVVDDGVANITGMATTDDIPTKTSDLTNDSNFVVDVNYVHTDNNYTTVEKTKLAGLENYDDSDIVQDISDLQDDISDLQDDVVEINEKIPAQASSTNQLADKAFVNSTIQTGTANFRGNWQNWASVPINADEYPEDYTGETTPSTNDYMVVQDASGYVDPQTVLAGTWRFKYMGNWATVGRNGWHPEYQVNETPMTAAQLAALNSGATVSLINQITTNEESIYDLESEKQDKITSDNKLSYSLLSGTPTIPTNVSDLTNDSGFITNTYKATSSSLGLVKPDGTTITIDSNGVISGSEGTTDYDDLDNRPSINNVTLTGNKTLAQIGATDLASFNALSQEVTDISNTVDTHDILIPSIDSNASTALSIAQQNNEDIITLKTVTLPDIRSDISDLDTNKQDNLVSGTNIKTINDNSILGSGNINTVNTFVGNSTPTSDIGNDGDIYFLIS